MFEDRMTDEEAIRESMMMFEEFFPKTFNYMLNEKFKTAEDFKKKLYFVDRKILAEETQLYLSILESASLNDLELCKKLKMLALNEDTPQSIFNRYTAASWVVMGLATKVELDIKKVRKLLESEENPWS